VVLPQESPQIFIEEDKIKKIKIMDKETQKLIGQLLVTSVVVVVGYEVSKRLRKNGEEKSSVRGNSFFKRKTRINLPPSTQSLGFCANDNPNMGGYFGDLPCDAGYYEVTSDSINFNGSNVRPVVEKYKTPYWVVG